MLSAIASEERPITSMFESHPDSDIYDVIDQYPSLALDWLSYKSKKYRALSVEQSCLAGGVKVIHLDTWHRLQFWKAVSQAQDAIEIQGHLRREIELLQVPTSSCDKHKSEQHQSRSIFHSPLVLKARHRVERAVSTGRKWFEQFWYGPE